MSENLFETQYDLTKKSKLQKFYDSYKIVIFSLIFVLLIFYGSFAYYLKSKENKKILLSEDYLQAKIYLEGGDKNKAIKLLKEVIFANDPTYSSLSLFLLMNQNLITDYKEISDLFDHLLKTNKFSKEVRNLLIYKKALLNSNYMNEQELLESIRPLLNTQTLWQPHGLILLGDYFVSKREFIKAREFYQKIFTIKNLQKDFYYHASFQLAAIANE
jgi:hypothetical protein